MTKGDFNRPSRAHPLVGGAGIEDVAGASSADTWVAEQQRGLAMYGEPRMIIGTRRRCRRAGRRPC
jgi:hypothetical protein